MSEKTMPIDVICQHSRNGETIPMRVRIQDEEGELQAYTIKGFRRLPDSEASEIVFSKEKPVFECRIETFGRKRTFKMFFDPGVSTWFLMRE